MSRRRGRLASALLALVWLLAPLHPVAAQVPDPGAFGPYLVDHFEYDAGYEVVTDPRGLPAPEQIKGSIHVPDGGKGPFPLILLQHGRHSTCRYGGSVEFLGSPCPDAPPATFEIRSYRGYDYLAANLASHGYVVASVSANPTNTYDTAASDLGAQMRAQVIAKTLDRLASWNTSAGPGELGTRLVGRLDLTRIGLMGHSRGGEGVTRFIDYNRTRTDGPTYPGLRAVFSLAPTDFGNQTAQGVHYATLLPLCDGDVSTLHGALTYDRGRFLDQATPFARVQFTVNGANHNYFNTIWTNDDGAGFSDSACKPSSPQRLKPDDQRRVGLVLMAAFLRRYAGGESAMDPWMTGAASIPPSGCPGGTGACTGLVGTSYLGPAASRRVLMVPGPGDVAGEPSGALTVTECEAPACPTQPNRALARQATAVWTDAGVLRFPLGAEDITRFGAVTFRTATNYKDAKNSGLSTQDLDVVLVDAAGGEASVAAAAHSTALRPVPGSTHRPLTLNGVRIPLSAFEGVDLEQVVALELHFGSRTSKGSIQLAEIGFQEAA